MTVILFFVFLLFALLDLSFLKKQAPLFFARVFRLPLPVIAVLGIFIILTILFGDSQEDILATWFLVLGGIYGFQRIRFKMFLPPDRKDPEAVGMGLCLAIDSFGILLKWFVAMLGVTLVFKVVASIHPVFSAELDEMVAVAAASFAVLILLIIRGVQRYRTLSLRHVLGLTRNQQGFFKLFVLPCVVGIGMAVLGAWLIASRASQPVTPLSEVISSATSSTGIAAFLIMAVLLAPFLEEIIFRGFFFYVIDQAKGRVLAVVVITGIFAAMHVEQYWGDWTAIAVVAVLGFVLTIFRAWTGSSIPGIIMHYIFNGLMTLIPIVMMLVANPNYYQYQVTYPSLNFEQKKVLLLKSIDEQPEFAAAYNDLAWLYAQKGEELPRALELVNQALVLEPESFAYLDTKAEVLFKMGDIPAAVAIAEGLVRKYPENAYAKEQLEKFQSTFHPSSPETPGS